MKTCWYKAIVGVDPKTSDCNRLHPNGCEDCLYFLPDPPEPSPESEEVPEEKKGISITPNIGMNSWVCRYCLAKVAFLQRRCNECGYGIRWS